MKRKGKRTPARRARTVDADALRKQLARAQRRLREVEQRHDLVMHGLHEGVYDWDIVSGALNYADRGNALGLPPGTLRNVQDWVERIHPEDRERYRLANIAHFKGATPRFECDYRYRAGDGSWRWARTHGMAIRDRRGRALRVIGSTGDITELKQAEIDTREALERQTATAEILELTARSPSDVQPVFEAIARNAVRLCEGAHCAVFRFDGGLQHFAAHCGVDPETVDLLRRRYPRAPDPARVSGRAILEREVIHLADALSDARFPGSVETLTSAGNRAVLAVPMLKPGGPIGVIFMVRRESRRFSEGQVALLRTFADQAVIAIENVRLFNETREALDQQKALAEVLGSMSSSIADTKPVFDLILDSCQRLFEGHLVGLTLAGEDGRVRLGAYKGENQEAMAAVYPYPLGRDSGSGQAILDRKVVHFPDVHAPGSDVPPRVLAGAQAAGFKAIIFAPLLDEGHGIGALWVGRRLPGPFTGRQTSLLQSFADQAVIAIRNARLFSEIREKSEQLEAANRHKSQFLANMSHELRTPLNAIIGFARIVARHSQGRLEPKQLENLEKIQASGRHLLALINAILDLAKVEAGRIEVQPSEVALAPVLEQCLRTVEPLVAVALVKEFDGGLPPMYVDEEKLRQIVLNLLSNAAKFTERGTIRLRAEAANGSVAIAVADTGIGIPGDKLGLIFEEFEQLDARINRAHGGTGLGLAIAQRLARLMGGDIGVESAPGGGSTFTLTLPLRYSA